MKILLVNPPNCGRSIPEERYGIDSIKQIFRGEPLALEALAGNLIADHEVKILDLKADPGELAATLANFQPELAGITGVTCEANTVIQLAREIKQSTGARIVVGGIHASNDPDFYNHPEIDYVVIGLGKLSFRELVMALTQGTDPGALAGIGVTRPGKPLGYTPRPFCQADLADAVPPAYDLVARYRESYRLKSLNLDMGFVVTAFGCPFNCDFCCIKGLTDGRYLTHSTEAVLRDIGLLGEIPVIRLLDANTFGNPDHAARLCAAIGGAGIKKQFLADVRSDTVVRYPELMQQWHAIGLRAVIIGFEEISDAGLAKMNKSNQVTMNTEAIRILHEIGITIIGDFILSPDYVHDDFARLDGYIAENRVDLPMITVMTPLPGTALHARIKDKITVHDLDYYTLTNAVTPTRMAEEEFYRCYAELMKKGHAGARL